MLQISECVQNGLSLGVDRVCVYFWEYARMWVCEHVCVLASVCVLVWLQIG